MRSHKRVQKKLISMQINEYASQSDDVNIMMPGVSDDLCTEQFE